MMTWWIILIALWAYPIITFVLVILTQNRILFKRRLIRITLVVTGLSIIGLITNISTTFKALDWILVTSIYFSICFFLWFSYFHFIKILKILAVICIIGTYTLGYLSGTIGALGVGFAISEYDTKIEKWIGNGLIYKETPLGNAISDYRGKRVEIYRTISWIPIIEWRILHKEYYNFITYANELKVDYQPDKKIIYLSATENWGTDIKIETWADTLLIGK